MSFKANKIKWQCRQQTTLLQAKWHKYLPICIPATVCPSLVVVFTPATVPERWVKLLVFNLLCIILLWVHHYFFFFLLSLKINVHSVTIPLLEFIKLELYFFTLIGSYSCICILSMETLNLTFVQFMNK